MAWRIEFDRSADRELAKLDTASAERILRFLHHRIAPLDNPRAIGAALTGARMGHLWRYRVSDFRVIVGIEDHALRILVVGVGNRRSVYR